MSPSSSVIHFWIQIEQALTNSAKQKTVPVQRGDGMYNLFCFNLSALTGISLSDEPIVFCHSLLDSEGKSSDKISQTKNSPGATWRRGLLKEMNQIFKQNTCQSYGKPSTLMRDYTHTTGPIFKMVIKAGSLIETL